jgi:hypothetical protein
MARYVVANTRAGASGFRPWQSRLLGDYQRASFAVPTDSYHGNDSPGAVTGGLGLDLSSVPSWAWLVGLGAAAFFFFKRRR